jgi:hypothetical protein
MTAEEATNPLMIMQRVGHLTQLATTWPTRWIVRRQSTAAGAFPSKKGVDDCRSAANTSLDCYRPEGAVLLTRTALNARIPIINLNLPVGHI